MEHTKLYTMELGLNELTIKFNIVDTEKLTVTIEKTNDPNDPDYTVTVTDKYGKQLASATSNWTTNRYQRNRRK